MDTVLPDLIQTVHMWLPAKPTEDTAPEPRTEFNAASEPTLIWCHLQPCLLTCSNYEVPQPQSVRCKVAEHVVEHRG